MKERMVFLLEYVIKVSRFLLIIRTIKDAYRSDLCEQAVFHSQEEEQLKKRWEDCGALLKEIA
jgi:hypothetical protein